MPRRRPKTEPLRSATGIALTREVAFRFALDPDRDLEAALWRHAGAARFAWNKAPGGVRHGLACRDERGTSRPATAEPRGPAAADKSAAGRLVILGGEFCTAALAASHLTVVGNGAA